LKQHLSPHVVVGALVVAVAAAVFLWPSSSPTVSSSPSVSETSPPSAPTSGNGAASVAERVHLAWTSSSTFQSGDGLRRSRADIRVVVSRPSPTAQWTLDEVEHCSIAVTGVDASGLCAQVAPGANAHAAASPLSPALQLWAATPSNGEVTTTLGVYDASLSPDGWRATGKGRHPLWTRVAYAGQAHWRRAGGVRLGQATESVRSLDDAQHVDNKLVVAPAAPAVSTSTSASRPPPSSTAAAAARGMVQLAVRATKPDKDLVWQLAEQLRVQPASASALAEAAADGQTTDVGRRMVLDVLAQGGTKASADALAAALASAAVTSSSEYALLLQRASLTQAPSSSLVDVVAASTATKPAAYALGAMAQHAHRAGDDDVHEAAKTALDAIKGDLEPADAAIAEGTAGAPDDVDTEAHLLALLGDGNAAVRRGALIGLRAYPSEAVTQGHLRALSDAHRSVQRASLQGLMRRPLSELHLRAVASAYDDNAFAPDQHNVLVTLLQRFSSSSAAARVLLHLQTNSPDPGVRQRLRASKR